MAIYTINGNMLSEGGELDTSFSLPDYMTYVGAYYDNGYVTDTSCAVTGEMVFADAVKVETSNSNILIGINNDYSAQIIRPFVPVRIVFKTADESTFTSDLLEDVVLWTTEAAYTKYAEDYVFTEYSTALASTTSTAFETESGKQYLISQSNVTYTVAQNGAVIKTATALGTSVGHGNCCNYVDGNAYISDWTDSTLIHVFTVDDDNSTLTYDRDITIPNTEFGRTQYFVFSGETQILGFGWKTGGSGDDPNVLVMSLWNYTTDGYEMSWSIEAPRVTISQGMTYQDGYVYYLDNTSSYTHINIIRINLSNGLIEEGFEASSGTLISLESEAIYPIGRQLFKVVTYTGRTFICPF